MTLYVSYIPNVPFVYRNICIHSDHKAFLASMRERPDLIHEARDGDSEAKAIHELEDELVGSDAYFQDRDA